LGRKPWKKLKDPSLPSQIIPGTRKEEETRAGIFGNSGLKRQNKGKLTDEAIDALFLELFTVARNLELPERVAYLGPEATFTHQAAESIFGATSSYLPISSINGIFKEISRGTAKFGC